MQQNLASSGISRLMPQSRKDLLERLACKAQIDRVRAKIQIAWTPSLLNLILSDSKLHAL
jgi:hypothetical protein